MVAYGPLFQKHFLPAPPGGFWAASSIESNSAGVHHSSRWWRLTYFFWKFSPRSLGKMNQFWHSHIFQLGGKNPPTRFDCDVHTLDSFWFILSDPFQHPFHNIHFTRSSWFLTNKRRVPAPTPRPGSPWGHKLWWSWRGRGSMCLAPSSKFGTLGGGRSTSTSGRGRWTERERSWQRKIQRTVDDRNDEISMGSVILGGWEVWLRCLASEL